MPSACGHGSPRCSFPTRSTGSTPRPEPDLLKGIEAYTSRHGGGSLSDVPRGPIPRSYWVEPERLLAGEYPGAGDEARAVERLEQIREAGIDFFLDLTHDDDGLPPYEAAIAPLEYRRIPVRDFSCPSHDEMRAILDAVDDALARGKCVYVHCWGGIGRTGTAIGCWLVRHGRSAEEALAMIARRRAETPDAARSSPETDEQRKLVEEWQPGD